MSVMALKSLATAFSGQQQRKHESITDTFSEESTNDWSIPLTKELVMWKAFPYPGILLYESLLIERILMCQYKRGIYGGMDLLFVTEYYLA